MNRIRATLTALLLLLYPVTGGPSFAQAQKASPSVDTQTANTTLLLLVNEPQLRDLLLGLLSHYKVTVVTTPVEARALLLGRRYDLVISTNFGVSPWEAVAVIPEKRSYPAFFVSGVWDGRLEQACTAKQLHCIRAPFNAEAFRRDVSSALSSK